MNALKIDALGMIETKGLIAAIEAADAMLKSADVELLEKTKVTSGIMTVTVVGDVGAVQAAVDAGAAAVNSLGCGLLLSRHVIPRVDKSLKGMIIADKTINQKKQEAQMQTEKPVTVLEDAVVKVSEAVENEIAEDIVQEIIQENMQEKAPKVEEEITEVHIFQIETQEDFELAVKDAGLEEVLNFLDGYKVVALRDLARKFANFGITGRALAKTTKTQLLAEFKKCYE